MNKKIFIKSGIAVTIVAAITTTDALISIYNSIPEALSKLPAYREIITKNTNTPSETANHQKIIEEIVFPGESIKICSYNGFSAERYDSEITITSTDPKIPDTKLRGYEKTLPTNKWIELWPHCKVKFTLLEERKGIYQISISYLWGQDK
ncbi:hypothetical protein [Marichromatium sp. AB31]|uniref:hypothetical protein n=1 Tax=Marichromatium sp. AB31 TaxID=2483362 RepID=UPI0011CDE39D|nr:hypothetical protein [Marichromatium sp. AB31]